MLCGLRQGRSRACPSDALLVGGSAKLNRKILKNLGGGLPASHSLSRSQSGEYFKDRLIPTPYPLN